MSLAGNVEMNSLQLRLAAEPPSVPIARHALTQYAKENGADAEAVAVAVTEVVTNAVLHGFPDARGQVLIEAWPSDHDLFVVVSDDGRGITPNPASPGLGYGLPLVAALTEEMGIEASEAGGTRLRMRFGAAG